MPKSPLVSIIMPSFNQRQFINQSIDSVLSQSYQHLELIIADGGSTDGTIALLANKADKDKRIKYVSEPDSGPAEALNKAIKHTTGTYIGWLNSDDLYKPQAIDRALNGFKTHPNWIMVYGQAEHIDERGQPIDPYPTLKPSVDIHHFINGCFICQPTVFFKRTMPVMLGEFDQSLQTAFDFEYWIRAFKGLQDRIGFVDAIQAQSRLHKNCITISQRRTIAIESIRVIANHFGQAPIHWLTTYIEEQISTKTKAASGKILQADILKMIKEVGSNISKDEKEVLEKKIFSDPLFQTA